ncbi:acetyltransferase [Rummeliibacillus pycnus]|uniref:acetyltransferase n=1 Tax=Rummeliibacillus pycnus TaxID=101070 RepID=UPI003D2E81AF
MNKPIIILGNGGHAAVLTDILIAKQREILGYTASKKEANTYGLKYLGDDISIVKQYSPESVELVLGIGSLKPSEFRMDLFNFFKNKGFTFATCIHPSAIIANNAFIAEGVQIMAGAIIQPRSIIKEISVINTGSIVEHDCMIERSIHIAPGVVMSGNVHIEEFSHIGTGAKIIQNINIGHHAMVGAGAVVVKDVAPEKVVMGIPAKEVKYIENMETNTSEYKNLDT